MARGVSFLDDLAVGGLALGTLALTPSAAAAGTTDPTWPSTNIRAHDPALVQLFVSGHERSLTFRELITEIDSSRWLVFLQRAPCRPNTWSAACFISSGVSKGHQLTILSQVPDQSSALPLISEQLAMSVQGRALDW